jgi:hypothetical protein
VTATLLALMVAALAAQATPAAPATQTAQAVPAAPPPPPVADLTPRPGSHLGGRTRCASCHTAEDWKRVTFTHERTGFPLTGRHQAVTCQACHLTGRYDEPVPKACSACHRDVHARRMGARCDRCHDTASWKEASFGPEAHRRTNFPLTGRHAVIPCEQCHGDRRDRAFARPTTLCIACHQADYDRTATTAIPHAGVFPTDCRGCHSTWRFKPGTWKAHDACFQITSGKHAGISCQDCHSLGLPTVPPGPLTCTATPPANCMGCHDPNEHPAVPGFAPSNQRCYECHQFSTGTPKLLPKGRRTRP